MPYYTHTDNVGPGGTLADAVEVRAEFDLIETGFVSVQTDVDRCLKLPDEATDQLLNLNASARANLNLGFDAAGALTATQAFGTYRGEWVGATSYVAGDLVKVSTTPYKGSIYIAASAHTSSALFATDVATKWTLVIDLSNQLTLANQVITNADSRFAASQGDDLLVDTASGRVDIDLPASPVITGGPITITLASAGSTVYYNPVTIKAAAGDTIMGGSQDMVFDAREFSVRVMWSSTEDWVVA